MRPRPDRSTTGARWASSTTPIRRSSISATPTSTSRTSRARDDMACGGVSCACGLDDPPRNRARLRTLAAVLVTALGTSVTHVPPVDNAPYDVVRVWFAFTGRGTGSRPMATCRSVPRDEPGVQRDARGEHRGASNHRRRPRARQVGQHEPPRGHRAARECSCCTRPRALRRADPRRQWRRRRQLRPRRVPRPAAPAFRPRARSARRTRHVNGLTPGGATSIGDGVELARTTLNAGDARSRGRPSSC